MLLFVFIKFSSSGCWKARALLYRPHAIYGEALSFEEMAHCLVTLVVVAERTKRTTAPREIDDNVEPPVGPRLLYDAKTLPCLQRPQTCMLPYGDNPPPPTRPTTHPPTHPPAHLLTHPPNHVCSPLVPAVFRVTNCVLFWSGRRRCRECDPYGWFQVSSDE